MFEVQKVWSVDSQENNKIAATRRQTPYFKVDMH